jgi:hypothetical protein
MELILGLTLCWASLVLFVCVLCVAVRRIDEELALDAGIVVDESLN